MIITPDGYKPQPYPRTKRLGFKHRTALIWSRANADEHGELVRQWMEDFVKANIVRWRGIQITEADLRDE